jgi:hypothetical protein
LVTTSKLLGRVRLAVVTAVVVVSVPEVVSVPLLSLLPPPPPQAVVRVNKITKAIAPNIFLAI